MFLVGLAVVSLLSRADNGVLFLGPFFSLSLVYLPVQRESCFF